MSAITLPKIVEAMENGLAGLDANIDYYARQIKELEDKRDKALAEAGLQRAALNAIKALDTELAKDGSTLKLRFYQ